MAVNPPPEQGSASAAGGAFFRFRKTETESLSMLKGETSWYEVSDRTDQTVWHVHVIGNCLGGVSTFHESRDSSPVLFELRPKRKVLNLTYFLHEPGRESPFATIRLFAGRGLRASDEQGGELFQAVDPQSKLDKFMDTVLEGCCTEYAIVAGGRVVGEFERRARTTEPPPPGKRPWSRLLRKLARPMLRDWCVERAADGPEIDPRILVASMILLIEQTIRMDQAGNG